LIDEKTHIANADAKRIGRKMLVPPNDGMKFLEPLPDGPLAKPARLKRKGWTQKKPPRGSRAAGGVAQTLDTRRM
jgi:hypothetical protein